MASKSIPRASRERLAAHPACLGTARGVPKDAAWRPKESRGAPGSAQRRPKATPSRMREPRNRVFLSAARQKHTRSRLFSVFRRFSINFSSNFAGCWYEFGSLSGLLLEAVLGSSWGTVFGSCWGPVCKLTGVVFRAGPPKSSPSYVLSSPLGDCSSSGHFRVKGT